MADMICSGCCGERDRPGQRYCSSCHAAAGLSDEQKHNIAHARLMVQRASPEKPEVCFDYELVASLLAIVDRLAAAPSPTTTTAGSMVQELDNFLSHVAGINDERDSVPILLGIRERWPVIRAMLASPTYGDGIEAAAKLVEIMGRERRLSTNDHGRLVKDPKPLTTDEVGAAIRALAPERNK